MYKLSFITILLNVILTNHIYSQSNIKREFRGVWVATVNNIDWPSSTQLTTKEQQDEFIELLRLHKANGLNVIIVQVRPSADVFYPSIYEPWSKWLTGKLGEAPFPYYDPLKFMIESAHEKGMEFHAWFNPYRAIVDVKKSGIDSSSIVFKHPQWFLQYGNNYYFDPGLPAGRKHTVNVIMEVVNNYDIDGIHFDDYFYPYRIKDLEFPDSVSFKLYGEGFIDIADWRRNNVDVLIEELSDSIRKVKPHVHFGVSPFGVWRNNDKDPFGSATKAGQTCYDDLYADVLKWLKEKWIDYVVPQIYWPIGFEVANYEVLAKWWNDNNYGIPVYIGHAAYRVGNNSDDRWKTSSQILSQIRLNRSLSNIHGSAYFSSKSFKSNILGLNDSLKLFTYKALAIPPEVRSTNIEKKRQYEIEFIGNQDGIQLLWKETSDDKLLSKHHRYVVYRKYKNKITPIAILFPPYHHDLHNYKDRDVGKRKRYQYAITSIDIYNHESHLEEFSNVIINRKNSWKVLKKKAISKS